MKSAVVVGLSVMIGVTLLLSPPTASAISFDGGAHRAVQQLLNRRVAAISSGDREAFLATVDPQASDEFRRRQAQYFDGWQSVPVERLRLRVRLDDSGDLAVGLDPARYGGALTFAPETRRTYRLGRYDSVDAVESLWMTYVKRGDTWKVAADDDFEPIGLVSAVNLWEAAPVVSKSTEHFLIIADESQRERLDELAAVAEEAFAVFDARWTEPWSERIPLLVPGTAEQISQLLGPSVSRDNFVAFVSYVPVRVPDYSVSAPRMYAGSALSGERSRSARVQDLVHELVHAATATRTGPYTPIWLQEGLAEYVRLNRPSSAIVTAPTLDRLPSTGAFAASNATELRKAYDTSLLAVARLSEARGGGAPMAYFGALDQRSAEAGSQAYNSNRALQESTGVDLAHLQGLLTD